MAIEFECAHCGKPLRVKSSLAGKVGACPQCKAKIHVPQSQQGQSPFVFEDVSREPQANPTISGGKKSTSKNNPLLYGAMALGSLLFMSLAVFLLNDDPVETPLSRSESEQEKTEAGTDHLKVDVSSVEVQIEKWFAASVDGAIRKEVPKGSGVFREPSMFYVEVVGSPELLDGNKLSTPKLWKLVSEGHDDEVSPGVLLTSPTSTTKKESARFLLSFMSFDLQKEDNVAIGFADRPVVPLSNEIYNRDSAECRQIIQKAFAWAGRPVNIQLRSVPKVSLNANNNRASDAKPVKSPSPSEPQNKRRAEEVLDALVKLAEDDGEDQISISTGAEKLRNHFTPKNIASSKKALIEIGMRVSSMKLDEQRLIKRFGEPDGTGQGSYIGDTGFPQNARSLRYGWIAILVAQSGEIVYLTSAFGDQ